MGIKDFINKRLANSGDSSGDTDHGYDSSINDWVQSQREIYGQPGRGRECESCQQDMSGSERTAAWEDGNNAYAYVRCRHCSHKNVFFD